jgi:hypothetical protein
MQQCPTDMCGVQQLHPSQKEVRVGVAPRYSMLVHLGPSGASGNNNNLNLDINKFGTGYMELPSNIKDGKVLLAMIGEKHMEDLEARGFTLPHRPTKVMFAAHERLSQASSNLS